MQAKPGRRSRDRTVPGPQSLGTCLNHLSRYCQNRPKDGTIFKKSKTESTFSGTHVNFDNGIQPYKTWQYGQSSTDRLR